MLERARAAIAAAPFGEPEDWDTALALTARAADAWATQIIAVSPQTQILWDWHHGIPHEVIAEFERRMADAPDLNPRARVLLAPQLAVVGDDDLMAEDSRRRSAFYAEFYDPVDASFAGLVQFAPVADEARIVLTVMRGRRAGRLDAEAGQALATLAVAWKSALRLKDRLEGRAAAMAAGAFGAGGLSVLLVDSAARVVAASPEAQAALGSQRHLLTRRGVLGAAHPRSEAELLAALAEVLAGPPGPASRSVLLEAPDGPLVAEVAALPPAQYPTHRTAVALVSLKPLVSSRPSASALIQRLYRLSPAEAEVALSIAAGLSVTEIADLRQVSIGTLRNQLKYVFDKCGVGSQAQLASKLFRLLGAAWLDAEGEDPGP